MSTNLPQQAQKWKLANHGLKSHNDEAGIIKRIAKNNRYKIPFFEAFKIIDYWKCLQIFLFRDCILSLLLKSKEGSLISSFV